MIEIDGSLGEGGGQILRSALSLSIITGKPFLMKHIRALRKPKPGLQPQHLASVNAAAKISQAELSGNSLGSSQLRFVPGAVKPGNYRFAIGTAGNTSLVLQTIALPLSWKQSAPSTITLEGGTHVSKSPCFHFLKSTWAGYLKHFGISLDLECTRYGFYPRGGGEVIATIQPTNQIKGYYAVERKQPIRVMGISAVTGLDVSIAERQARRARIRLEDAKLESVCLEEIVVERWMGGTTSFIGMMIEHAGITTLFHELGERGKPSESVADAVCDQVLAYLKSGGVVDSHSADQIILPLMFAKESSEFRVSEITQHLLTNIDTIRLFLDREISLVGQLGESGVVMIR